MAQQDLKKIYPGKRVRTLLGENDTDHTGAERFTPAGTWGHVCGHNHEDHWDVSFPNGAWLVMTEAELLNQREYQLAEPITLEQSALALRFGQDVCELTILDDQMIGFTQDVAGNPEQILDLLQKHQRLLDDAHEMIEVVRRAWNRWDREDQDDNPSLGDELERIACSTYSWQPSGKAATSTLQGGSSQAPQLKLLTGPQVERPMNATGGLYMQVVRPSSVPIAVYQPQLKALAVQHGYRAEGSTTVGAPCEHGLDTVKQAVWFHDRA